MKLNLNTVFLSLILPALLWLANEVHHLDIRLSRMEQQMIDHKLARK